MMFTYVSHISMTVGLLWKSQWNCPGNIMKITMKSPRQYYENHNEISLAILWKSQWNILGNIMKIAMKSPWQYYENRNEIAQAILWKSQWNIPGIIMKITMKYPWHFYEITPPCQKFMKKARQINEWNTVAKEWDVSLNLLALYTMACLAVAMI